MIDLTEYIKDDIILSFYLDNFDSDYLEDFVSWLNKNGVNREQIRILFCCCEVIQLMIEYNNRIE